MFGTAIRLTCPLLAVDEKAVYRDGTIGVMTDLTRVSSPIASGDPSLSRSYRWSTSSGTCDARFCSHPALIAQLTAGATGPATAAGRVELLARLNDALAKMDATDREVLALRHYEQLTSAEAAQVLGIQERAAAKRYTRALERLREMLAEAPGGLTEFRT